MCLERRGECDKINTRNSSPPSPSPPTLAALPIALTLFKSRRGRRSSMSNLNHYFLLNFLIAIIYRHQYEVLSFTIPSNNFLQQNHYHRHQQQQQQSTKNWNCRHDRIIDRRNRGPVGFGSPIGTASKTTNTALYGIRGFRAWFESQFPTAMTAFDHPATAIPHLTQQQQQHYIKNSNTTNKKDSEQQRKKKKSASSSSTTNTTTKPIYTETFDHVLIDMNQLLHITLRRSKSDDHALILLLKELDKCLSIAKPTKSIVLSFDGPPAAAKLATQRRRRYGIITRNVRKKQRVNLLIQKGLIANTTSTTMSTTTIVTTKERKKHKMNREELEELTLSITPGTQFMERAENAVLYWAWQRLSNVHGKMQLQNCRIYVSPSSVPGEGEVKLLDWLFQAGKFTTISSKNKGERRWRGRGGGEIGGKSPIIKRGDSVAIMGGDSDLVLEGLIIPPSITHNVFVILPSGNSRSYAISLWETTLTLRSFLSDAKLSIDDTMRIRTDLVLLLIMNGNDYLPKLRGSSGFNKLFHTYLSLLKKWLSNEDDNKKNPLNGEKSKLKPFFVDPNKLELNLPFCVAFFEALAIIAPKCLAQQSELIPFQKSITPLSHLYSMVDSGLLPGPAVFTKVEILDENDAKDEIDKSKEILILTLGQKQTTIADDSSRVSSSRGNDDKDQESQETNNMLKQSYEFEVLHRVGKPLKKTRQLLASIALEELLGKDYLEMNDYIVGNDVDNEDEVGGDDEIDEDEEDSEDGNNNGMGSSASFGYSWEMDTAAACNVEEYLKGLIWNLAMYQDGVCSDYGYNYGRRMSPTADEMLDFLKNAEENNQCIGRKELLSNNFTQPLSDGLSCLAALPTEVKHLIPEPYNKLSINGTIEDVYASCMDEQTNVFDLQSFQQKCYELLNLDETPTKSFNSSHDIHEQNVEQGKGDKNRKRGRTIRTGKTFWTVLKRVRKPLQHPYAPPCKFSPRLSNLRNDNKIKVFHMHSTDRPRWLMSKKGRGKKDEINESKFTDMSEIISDSSIDSLDNIEYMKVYQRSNKGKKKTTIKQKKALKRNGIKRRGRKKSFEGSKDSTYRI